jgi:hypothetical protein
MTHNPVIHEFCQKLLDRGLQKMASVDTAMHKLLVLTYGVIKSDVTLIHILPKNLRFALDFQNGIYMLIYIYTKREDLCASPLFYVTYASFVLMIIVISLACCSVIIYIVTEINHRKQNGCQTTAVFNFNTIPPIAHEG